MPGNEIADSLAKNGTQQTQIVNPISLSEAKSAIKSLQQTKWLTEHPNYKKNDAYHNLTRPEQVIVFRLGTGHNRLNYHLYKKFNVGSSEQCPCNTDRMTAEHILQSCPIHQRLREEMWPDAADVQTKLYGSLRDLQTTAAFIQKSEVTI